MSDVALTSLVRVVKSKRYRHDKRGEDRISFGRGYNCRTARRIRAGQTSVVQIVQKYIDRARAYNGVSSLFGPLKTALQFPQP